MKTILNKLKHNIDGETILLAMMIVVSGGMLVTADNYPTSAARFPQVMSTVVLLGGSILLLDNLFPSLLPISMSESSTSDSLTDVSESPEISEKLSEITEGSSDQSSSALVTVAGLDISRFEVTIFLTVLYTASGLVVGYIWTTPFFVASYSKIMDISNRHVVLLALLSLGIAYVFMDLFRLPLNEGLITGWVL